MKQIPAPSKKRLIVIARILEQVRTEKKEKITSAEIAERTSWSESSIRRDISLLELRCGTSNGYSTEELKKSIEEKLNLALSDSSDIKRCCIVGLGKIGSAFLDESMFSDTRFKIVAGFDANQNRIEILESKFPLYSTSNMESIIRAEKIQFALLCVPDEHAPKYADKLAECGIKGIVNYTKTFVAAKPGVKIENASPVNLLENLL